MSWDLSSSLRAVAKSRAESYISAVSVCKKVELAGRVSSEGEYRHCAELLSLNSNKNVETLYQAEK